MWTRPERGQEFHQRTRGKLLRERILDIFRESIGVKEKFITEQVSALEGLIRSLAGVLSCGRKVLIFGNGGSAADAQHIAAEFVNRYLTDRPPLPAVALTTDTSILTAIANDFSFDEIFEKQIKALGSNGDAAWGISTSGRSANVIRGLKAAREMGLLTVGTGGPAIGAMKEVCDHYLSVEGASTPRIQETHLLVAHTIVEMVDHMLFPGPEEN